MGRTVFFSAFLVLLLFVPASALQDPPAAGGHSGTCPVDCPVCQAAIDKALGYIVSKQQEQGHWNCGNAGYRVVAASCGLAMLATGEDLEEGKYSENISKALAWLINLMENKPNHTFECWNTGFVPMFFCEIYVRNRDADLRGLLEKIGNQMKDNQEEDGAFLHAPLENGKKWPYGTLIATTHINIATWGMLQRLGIKIPKGAFQKALGYADQVTNGDGGVRYGLGRGQRRAEVGRTSALLHAYNCCEIKPKKYAKMVEYFRARMSGLPNSHASPGMHLLTGAFAAYELGKSDWDAYWKEFRDRILAKQQADGSWGTMGPGGGIVGPIMDTAWMTIILQIPKGNLDFLLCRKKGGGIAKGKKGPRKPWFGVQVEPTDDGQLKVIKTYSGSTAQKLKVKKDDVLLQVNGKDVKKVADLDKAVRSFKKGKEITVVLRRGDKELTMTGQVKEVPRSYSSWSAKKKKEWH
ncbi:MAG: DUF6288 domain-containing protein [Planctomycetota bacterium]|jgi:hypothetical protein